LAAGGAAGVWAATGTAAASITAINGMFWRIGPSLHCDGGMLA